MLELYLGNDRYRVRSTKDNSTRVWEFTATSHETVVNSLAGEGLRLLTFDEWEDVCSGGSSTLFRWGD
ncbi:MAG: hypothetical protein AB4290_02365 [Spirulina sp.]